MLIIRSVFNTNKVLVSVIIAAYNEEKNIERCVLSILNQSYKNIEIIVIDDGSVDKTWDILQNLHKKYNIQNIKQKNMGVASARNRGIQEAKGEWISFCDADDIYLPFAIEEMLFAALKYEGNIVQGGLKRSTTLKKSDQIKALPSKVAERILLNYETKLNDVKYSWVNSHIRKSIHGPYGKLICRDLIVKNNIFFPNDLKLGEDLLFYLSLLSTTESIVILEKDVYDVTPNLNSVTRKFNVELPDAADKFVYKVIHYLQDNNRYSDLKDDLNYQIYMHFIVATENCYMHNDNKNCLFKRASEFRRFANKDIYRECFNYMLKYASGKSNIIGLRLLNWKMYYLYFFLRKMKRR